VMFVVVVVVVAVSCSSCCCCCCFCCCCFSSIASAKLKALFTLVVAAVSYVPILSFVVVVVDTVVGLLTAGAWAPRLRWLLKVIKQ